ncbi:MAG: outer membrane protein assembly factor BamB family protein [Endomicrobiales bacterium]
MKIRYCAFFLVFLLAYTLARPLYAASWPLFRATPERTGARSEVAYPALAPLWNYRIQGEFISSPVVYKDLVHCGARDGSVWAWDISSGEAVWQYSTGGWVDASVCVSSTTVFAPGNDGNLYAFDRLSGDIKWQAHTGSSDCSSPVLHGDKLYFLSGHPERKVYCYSAESGALLASYPVSQFGFSSPALEGDALFFGTNDGQFHCLDLNTGQVRWSRRTEGGVFFNSLATTPDAVYAVSGGDERRLFCLNPQTGAALWSSVELDTHSASVSSVSVGRDKVFVACSLVTQVDAYTFDLGLELYAFPKDAGSLETAPLWSASIGYPHPSGIVSSPAVAGDVIYIGSGDGYLYCINAVDGRYIEPGTGNLSSSATAYYLCYDQTPVPGIVSSPAVSNGKVYAGTIDGNFWAFQAQKAVYLESPDEGEVVVNQAQLKGAVRGLASSGYTLACGAGKDPSSWADVTASTANASGEDLGTWDTRPLADGLYRVRLSAENDPAYKAENLVTVNNSPAPPPALSAADTPFDGGGSLTLSWTCSADDGRGDDDVAGYRVYKSSYAGGYAFLSSPAKGASTFIDTACPIYTTWYYALSAFDALSESGLSDAAAGFSEADGVEIAPETGGTVTMVKDGLTVELVIEPGSFEERVWVGILSPSSFPDTGIPSNARAGPRAFEFGITPAGTRFLKPVTIKLPYRPQDFAGMDRDNLRIYWWDESKGEWRTVNTSDPLAENGRVQARIPHFSLYRVMEYTPGREELLSNDRVYTYPNPARGKTLSFKYYLGDKADVVIDVYNVAGQRIARLEKEDNPAGLVSELEWNVEGIASGVYVYRLEAKSASKSKAVKKKLAIIH